MERLFDFYGIDWFAMALNFLAVYLLGVQNKTGFLIFILANLSWVSVGMMTGSYAIVAGNLGFVALNSLGFWRWHKKQQRKHEKSLATRNRFPVLARLLRRRTARNPF
ncbi:MAG: nicotinamide mononucleotide transporter [Bacteroidota bacterium]